MKWDAPQILSVLQACSDAFTFPMLDNGYVYPAASRLTLHRSEGDWGLTIEIFGHSPRSGIPDTHIHTFGSRLVRPRQESDFASDQAYLAHLANNPYNESAFVFPVDEGDWQDPDDWNLVAETATTVFVRGKRHAMPSREDYARSGIPLEDPSRVQVFELCRFLAIRDREGVLATARERRRCLPPELTPILQLDEWHHPDLANGEPIGGNATFASLADALATGDPSAYRSYLPSNTHWRHWPEAGTL
jgi:hypothetical protein